MLRKERVARQIALDDERPEVLDIKEPHGLRDPQLIQPMHLAHLLDAAPQQRARSIAHRGEIDGTTRCQHLLVIVRGHAALADQDAAAGLLEPARNPFGETKRCGCRHSAHVESALAIRCRRG